MRVRRKWIVIGALLVIAVVCSVPAISVFLFDRERAKMVRETPSPPCLKASEISVIEEMLGVVFPSTTSQIKTYFSRGHSSFFYCVAEFGREDLDKFKQGRDWVPAKDVLVSIKPHLRAPLRPQAKGFYAAEPIEWWTPSQDRLEWLSRVVLPKDPGGHIVILLERSPSGTARAYITMVGLNSAFPEAIFKIYPNLIGWDLRERCVGSEQGVGRP